MFKTVLFAALAVTAWSLPALAGEGNGEPFPFRSNGVTATTSGPRQSFDVGSSAYPDVAGRAGTTVGLANIGIVPETGSEQSIQTANSLPPGFEDGMPAYAHLWTASPTRLAAVR